MTSETLPTMVLDTDLVDGEITDKMKKLHKKVSKIKTPKKYTNTKKGFTYVKRHYMKLIADKHYPGWSWLIIKSESLGDSAYIVHGRLIWNDCGVRRIGDMVAGHRIQKLKQGNGYVDIGNDVKSANQDCFKKALNQYMNIADDVYKMGEQEIDRELVDTLLNLVDEIGEEFLKTKMISKEKINAQLETGEINTRNIRKSIQKLESIKIEKENLENDK